MAKTLQERLEAAKSPRARLADNEALLEDLKAERDRLEEARDAAAKESIDFALSDEDRDEAAAKASRCERTIKALATEIVNLAAEIEAKRDSESRKAADAEKAAALAERDTLAAEFEATVKPAVASFVDLFTRIEANAQRMAAAGVREGCAEAQARGLPRFIGNAGEPERFLKLKLPRFEGAGRVWPIDRDAEERIRMAEQEQARRRREVYERSPEAAAKRAEAKRKAAEEHAKVYGRYRLSTGLSDQYGVVPVRFPEDVVERSKGLPHSIVRHQDWIGEIAHADAAELRKVAHLKVQRLDGFPPPSPEPTNIPPAPPVSGQITF